MSDLQLVIERLTMECAHFRLSGPWTSAYEDGDRRRHMIGDITWCEVCPRTPRPPEDPAGPGMEMMLREIVNVERIPPEQYREPDDAISRARREQIHG